MSCPPTKGQLRRETLRGWHGPSLFQAGKINFTEEKVHNREFFGNELELGYCLAQHLESPTQETLISTFLMNIENALKYKAVSDSDIRLAKEALIRFNIEETQPDELEGDNELEDWEDEESDNEIERELDKYLDEDGESPDLSVEAGFKNEESTESIPEDTLPVTDDREEHDESEEEDEEPIDIDPASLQFSKPRPQDGSIPEEGSPKATPSPYPNGKRPRGKRKPPSKSTEKAAIDIVTRYGKEQLGAKVEDVQTLNLGWDLEFLYEDGRRELVEVKGSRENKGFIITRNELRAAQIKSNYVLFFVNNLGKGKSSSIACIKDFGDQAGDKHLSAIKYDVHQWSTLRHELIDITFEQSHE